MEEASHALQRSWQKLKGEQGQERERVDEGWGGLPSPLVALSYNQKEASLGL
jgi:hypothetical protein